MLPPLKTGLSFEVIIFCSQLEAFCISSPMEFPLTNFASKWRKSFNSLNILIEPPALYKSSIYPIPEGFKSTIIGRFWVSLSKFFKSIFTPRRPAIAVRWTTPFVDPPIADKTVNAFIKLFSFKNLEGFRFSLAILTDISPVFSAIRFLSADTAGAHALFGTINPSASVVIAIVLAVPMTPHVPTVGTSWLFTSSISSSLRSSAL